MLGSSLFSLLSLQLQYCLKTGMGSIPHVSGVWLKPCSPPTWLLIYRMGLFIMSTFVVVQSLRHVQLFVTPWTAACQAPLFSSVSQSCSNSCSLSWCCYLTISSSTTLFPDLSQHQVFFFFFPSESTLCIRWPKYWSFNFSTSPSNEYSGLISFSTDWFDLLVVQGTLKSLLHHHNLKASILCICKAHRPVSGT